ncbi:MAG: pyridoxamine 5'-phosphate oxidase [Paludibacteraceae bacterium]|nr:pyridoxamine 5'-phosphate oxidase [Paludibacteraceae bacterium]
MLRDIRKQYQYAALTEEHASQNPFSQFDNWLSAAVNSEEAEPTAMVLSTVDADMQPHSRVVLLKEFTENGFVFFTNYEGNKSKEIASNAKVALLFFWQGQERQVRITGVAEKIDSAASDDYFYSRPVESRIGAWASPQSQPIEKYDILAQRFEAFKKQFGENIPRPPHWGGFVVKPDTFEFWQGRPSRLHDRLFYSMDENSWRIERLAP